MMTKVGRGAVSIRDLQGLAQVASTVSPNLARSANALVYAFEPDKFTPPKDHLRPISKKKLAALLGDCSSPPKSPVLSTNYSASSSRR